MEYRKLARYIPHKHDPKIGETYWFEYHCWEDEDSADAELWHHTHQQVVVTGRGDGDMDECVLCPYDEDTMGSSGEVWNSWKIRFRDGYTHTAAPDELMKDPGEFSRPDYKRQT